MRRALLFFAFATLLLIFNHDSSIAASTAVSPPPNFNTAIKLPKIGDHALRIISPTVLELSLVNTQESADSRPTIWDWVDESTGQLNINFPDMNDLAVTVNGTPSTIAALGFKRIPRYAPLAERDLRIDNALFIELDTPIPNDALVVVTNPSENGWPSSFVFSETAVSTRFSPAIHVNQVGYEPNWPKKAQVGYYLGTLGELTNLPSSFSLIDANTNAVVYSGSLTLRQDVGYTYTPTPYQQLVEADFSDFTAAGKYRLQVAGMGASYPFVIAEGITAVFARTYTLGTYHQRSGFDHQLPYTRFVDGPSHTALAEIPTADAEFNYVWSNIASVNSNYTSNPRHTAPQLVDIDSQLYPFVNSGTVDVSGGHMDAGDYSKYTINTAQTVHALTFAVDSLANVADLDNLGLPESGDGISDILQEAKYEADFLAKMQDADGGFYFLVYPKARRYETDVLPSGGDTQVVYPKNTSATAAATAALAEIASSPAFIAAYPTKAAAYLQQALDGWAFLMNAIDTHGKDGSYQKITHYGDVFMHDDELVWAAAALFAATGESQYQDKLMEWMPDPTDRSVIRWSWWRGYEGYGGALRSYAFAARSGRIDETAFDAAYLALIESEIAATGNDALRWSDENAYGVSFPHENKRFQTAGWYFPNSVAFDIAAAYQIDPNPDYLEALLYNINYVGGSNPRNQPHLMGIGWQRQLQIVSQFDENHRRELPPTGIPVGSVQEGPPWLGNYQTSEGRSLLGQLVFPRGESGIFSYYDRWTDTHNVMTEATITEQARATAVSVFLMAQTNLKTQAWTPESATITGVPAIMTAGDEATAQLTLPNNLEPSLPPLSNALVVWEARDQAPTIGESSTFTPTNAGTNWVEAEIYWPDGRRLFAAFEFMVQEIVSPTIEDYQAKPLATSPDLVAWYPLDGALTDARGQQAALSSSGNGNFDDLTYLWNNRPSGQAYRFYDVGDTLTVPLPKGELYQTGQTQAVSIEAMIYIENYMAYSVCTCDLLNLVQTWDVSLQFKEDKWQGVMARAGVQTIADAEAITPLLTRHNWHHLKLMLNEVGYMIQIDGQAVGTLLTDIGPIAFDRTPSVVTIGNFDGWIDEVVIKSIQAGGEVPKGTDVAISQAESGLLLAWQPVTEDVADNATTVTAYQIFRSTTPYDISGGSFAAVFPPRAAFSFMDETAVSGTNYFYGVRARNGVGDGSVVDWNGRFSFEIQPGTN
ncbi:MAG: glycoside hydrolase family 9 protein [Chloroflexota bacterium]